MTYDRSKITPDQTQPLFVGLDVHKSKWSICIIHQGVILERHTIPCEYHALNSILSKYKSFTINQIKSPPK